MRYSIRLRHGWARDSFLLLLNISEAQFLCYWDSDEDVESYARMGCCNLWIVRRKS